MLSIVILLVIASLTVYTGCKLSVGNSLVPLEPSEIENTEMTMIQALFVPLTASVSLLILFFFFSYVQYILVGLLVFIGALSLYQLIFLSLKSICATLNGNLLVIVSLCATIVAVVDWISTGNIIFHNLLGCSLCMVFISTLRFPSLKVATFCLSLLVIYDIFWVFFSEYFFDKNVMVDVAMKVASNPVYDAGQHFHIDMKKYVSPTVELPIKLMIPNFETGRMVMLGLGDIALPGALVAFALRCDMDMAREREGNDEDENSEMEAGNLLRTGTSSVNSSRSSNSSGLFEVTMTGYVLGLVGAFVGNILSGVPQPALIYLVPSVLLSMVLRAWQIGQLKNVWHGISKDDASV